MMVKHKLKPKVERERESVSMKSYQKPWKKWEVVWVLEEPNGIALIILWIKITYKIFLEVR